MAVREKIYEILGDNATRKRLYFVTLMTALFILALTVRPPGFSGRIVTDDSGAAVGIQRDSTDSTESCELLLDIYSGERKEERNVTLILRPSRDNTSDEKELSAADLSAAEADAEIDRIMTEMEYSGSSYIELPSSLSDGSRLIWKSDDEGPGGALLLITAVYIMLVVLTVKNRFSSYDREEMKIRKAVLHDLPRFCNQLFLMMNAGMILSDAFDCICASYIELNTGETDKNRDEFTWFEHKLVELYLDNQDHRRSTSDILTEFAAGFNVKELARIAAILAANEKRGSDIIENLCRESRYLWDDRKLVARENGKLIDTKMAYPLGALLLLLIVITMAPALLSF